MGSHKNRLFLHTARMVETGEGEGGKLAGPPAFWQISKPYLDQGEATMPHYISSYPSRFSNLAPFLHCTDTMRENDFKLHLIMISQNYA